VACGLEDTARTPVTAVAMGGQMNQVSSALLLFFAWTATAGESAAQSDAATRTQSLDNDKKAAIAVVLAHEQECQSYDFDKFDSLHTPDFRGIEESYPQPRDKG
jgi:hypothetical protein